MQPTPWMSAAFAEVGVTTYPPGQNNPRVTEYHARTNIRGTTTKPRGVHRLSIGRLQRQESLAPSRRLLARGLNGAMP